MNTWKRGRKKATLKQQNVAYDFQTTRVKIANLIARKADEINKICCVCEEKEGKILHNKEIPYYICFICNDCRKDKNSLTIAEENRFDIRDILDKKKLSVKNFTDAEVIRIMLSYMHDSITMGEYCKKTNISRYQLNQLAKRYQILVPNEPIENYIEKHKNAIHGRIVAGLKEQKRILDSN